MRSFWPWLWGVLGVALILRATFRSRGVILDHLEFGRRLFTGNDLYAPYLDPTPLHPVYPPSFGLLTAPFSLVDYLLGETAARFAWVSLQVLALFVIGLCLRDFLRRLAPTLLRHTHLILFVTALVTLRYILRDTHGGGGNLINLGLVLLALKLATDEPGRPLLAGLLLGLSLATKPTTILMVPLLWLFGQRRAAGYSVLWAGLLLGIALIVHGQGFHPFLRWFDGSVAYGSMTNLFADPQYGFPPFTWMNQCLRCMGARYLGSVPEEFASQVPPALFFQGIGLSHDTTAWISRGLGLLLLGISGWIVYRRRSDPNTLPLLTANILCLSLLLSPISWKAHHVALIPAIFLVVVRGFGGPPRPRWPWIFLGAYVMVCGLGEELVGKENKNAQQSLYLTTLGTLVLWGITSSPRLFCTGAPDR